MKKSLLLLISICSLWLLNGCGGGSSSPPPLTPDVATHFSVAPATATPTAGTAFNFTVTALDGSNGVVSSYAGTVHFTSSDGQAMLPANSTLTNGTGTFSATLKTVGGQTITATDMAMASITGTSNSINVTGSPATHFSVVAPANDTPGTSFSFTVSALDASNNLVTNYAGTVYFRSTDGQAVLPATSTLTNGTGTFSATMKTFGGQTITATDTATASITGTSNSINVTGSPATHFSVVAPANDTPGTSFSFTVSALDASNNLVTNYAGTVYFRSTDGQAVLPANSALANGTATFSATLKTLGGQTITAADTATATISGTSNSINVTGPPATHFSVVAPANATVGTAFDITVTALDASNNVAASYSGTVHFTSTDGQADLPANSILMNGTANFPAGLKTVGGQTITATDTVTASITGSSRSINVSASTAGNPVPLIYQPLSPDAVVPGGLAFKLTVNGTGFVSGSTVKWNGSARATNFVSDSKLTATLLATDVASFNTASVTVFNPSPGGGASNVVFFETTRPTSSVALSIPSEVAAGSDPDSVAVGDFNGDGKLDLVVANQDGTVSVLLGKGDGTFQPAVNYEADHPAGTEPSSVAVGDFNGDGKLDLLVVNSGSSDVSVLLGNGDGTFQTALYSSFVEVNPGMVAVGDFDGDGKLDLVVVNSKAGSGGSGVASNNVSVLLGNGDGTFQTALDFDAGVGPISVAVGDFNADGRLDLVVANYAAGNVGVLLGNGDGTFQPAVNYGSGSLPVSVAVGDFNGDGKLDLAVANVSIPSRSMVIPSMVISVLLGNGDGTFKPAVEYGGGSDTDSSSVALGDFNGDGKLDMAVASSGSTNRVSILLGNGDGTFQSAVDYAGASLPGTAPPLVVGDFNGDGRLDMAVIDAASSTVSVLLQPGLVSGSNAILSPTSLTFATQLVGTASPVQSVLLNNYGTTTLSIAAIAATNNFSETDTCGSSVAAGASCTISVIFTPSVLGNLSGTLSITDDAPGSPQTVPLSGTGTVVELVPTQLNFGCAPYGTGPCSGPEQVTLTNAGATALTINGITVTGPFSQANNCGTSLGAGQSCTITVSWSFSAGEGVLSVSDNGGASPQTVALSGQRSCFPGMNCSGPAQVTLTNAGPRR